MLPSGPAAPWRLSETPGGVQATRKVLTTHRRLVTPRRHPRGVEPPAGAPRPSNNRWVFNAASASPSPITKAWKSVRVCYSEVTVFGYVQGVAGGRYRERPGQGEGGNVGTLSSPAPSRPRPRYVALSRGIITSDTNAHSERFVRDNFVPVEVLLTIDDEQLGCNYVTAPLSDNGRGALAECRSPRVLHASREQRNTSRQEAQ